MASIDFVGVDWGTSSFRAWYCLAGKASHLIYSSDMGMSKVPQDDFAPYLEKILIGAEISETVPILICGMAGARGGWREVPYAKAPASQTEIAAKVASVRAGQYMCRILPGVSLANRGHFDVMRGEETLLIGALARGAGDGLYCLPGTHSKWCWIKDGRLQDWQTVMTGELFALLSKQSTLSGFCDGTGVNLHLKPEFTEAVRDVLSGEGSAINNLFAIRARALLDPEAGSLDFAARLSGLLIGQEIAGRELDDFQTITLISCGAICEAYQKALDIAGKTVKTMDANEAVCAGLDLLAEELFASGNLSRKSA